MPIGPITPQITQMSARLHQTMDPSSYPSICFAPLSSPNFDLFICLYLSYSATTEGASQIHQRVLLDSISLDKEPDTAVVSSAGPDGHDLLTHDSRGIRFPVLRFLEIKPRHGRACSRWRRAPSPSTTLEPYARTTPHHTGPLILLVRAWNNTPPVCTRDDKESRRSERDDVNLRLSSSLHHLHTSRAFESRHGGILSLWPRTTSQLAFPPVCPLHLQPWTAPTSTKYDNGASMNCRH